MQKPSPWGWSYMQSHMQDREMPKSHYGHNQAENQSAGGGCNTRAELSPVAQQGLGTMLS